MREMNKTMRDKERLERIEWLKTHPVHFRRIMQQLLWELEEGSISQREFVDCKSVLITGNPEDFDQMNPHLKSMLDRYLKSVTQEELKQKTAPLKMHLQ